MGTAFQIGLQIFVGLGVSGVANNRCQAGIELFEVVDRRQQQPYIVCIVCELRPNDHIHFAVLGDIAHTLLISPRQIGNHDVFGLWKVQLSVLFE